MDQSTEYKVSLDGHVIDLADGRTAGPGEFVKLTAEDLKEPHNKALIDEGHLLKVEEAKKTKTGEGS